MGLFHDTCVCGHKVPKKARMCSNCGRGAPNGWTKCPGCGKWVGNDSAHCPHCNHPLHPAERVDLAGGVWDRKAGLFAQRFELGDVSRMLQAGLNVQEGTLALLLEGGKAVDLLGPGPYTPKKAGWFENPPPRSVVLVDAGDVVFRVDFAGRPGAGGPAATPLRSKEELPVCAVAEVTLRFSPEKAEAFLSNFMKEQRAIATLDVCAWLYEETLSAVRDLCQRSTIEELVKDPDRRPKMEETIAKALEEPLARCGMRLVRVGAVEFYGRAYEEVRQKYGELDQKRRLLEYEREELALLADKDQLEYGERSRKGKLSDKERMEQDKRAADVRDYLDQLAQEKELTSIERQKETSIAVRVAKGEVDRVEAELAAARALEKHAREMTELADSLELDLTLKNYNREQLLADARNQAELAALRRRERELDARSESAIATELVNVTKAKTEAKKIQADEELRQAEHWLRIKAEKLRIKNEDLRVRAETLAGKSLEELAALAADPETREAFLKQALAKLNIEAESGMTAEQLLARAAATSPAAAETLARMHEAEEKASAKVLAELKAAEADRHEHDDKVLEKLAEVAKAAVEHQSSTIVVPGQPNIVH